MSASWWFESFLFSLLFASQLIRQPQMEVGLKGEETAQHTRTTKRWIFICLKVEDWTMEEVEPAATEAVIAEKAVQLFWQRKQKVKVVREGLPGHMCYRWRDQFLSQKGDLSDWGKGRKREVCRHRELIESVSCCLSPGGNRTAHNPLGPSHLRIPLPGHGYIQSRKC